MLSRYYAIQGIAWALVAFQQILISIVFNDFRVSRSIFILSLSCIGFLITHFYRYYTHKHQIFDKSLSYQIKISIISCITLGSFWGVLSFYGSVIFLLNKKVWLPDLRLASIAFNCCIIIGLWIVLYHSYQYFQHLLQKSEEKWQLQKAMQETETELLQLQINPHFLFNALNAIRSLIITSPANAQQGVIILRKLLTEGYSKIGFGIILLTQELAIVERYMALEQLRFGDKIDFHLEIPEYISNLSIPAGVILTLTENAVKHGGKQKSPINQIQVRIQQLDQQLQIAVTNTGIFKEKVAHVEGGIGLQNLEKRLRIYAGNYFTISAENLPNEKVSITLSLPVNRAIS